MSKRWWPPAALTPLLALTLLIAGCGKSSLDATYPLPPAAVYAQLLGLDARRGTEGVVPATNVVVETVPGEAVTWHFMMGEDETARFTARLAAAGPMSTALTLDIDTSHAKSEPALARTTARLGRSRQLSTMSEKIAALLEGRDYDEARVTARLKEFGNDDVAAKGEMVANLPEMESDALHQYAQMKREISDAEAADKKRDAEHDAAPPPDSTPSRPLTYAEEQAERQRNR